VSNQPAQQALLEPVPELGTRARLVKLVQSLAEEDDWKWVLGTTDHVAADRVLRLLANAGLIEHRKHPKGGNTWIIDGQMFGQTESVLPDFLPIPSPETEANRLRLGQEGLMDFEQRRPGYSRILRLIWNAKTNERPLNSWVELVLALALAALCIQPLMLYANITGGDFLIRINMTVSVIGTAILMAWIIYLAVRSIGRKETT